MGVSEFPASRIVLNAPTNISCVWLNRYGRVANTRSSLILFACIGVAPPQLFTPCDQSRGETTMQAKWIKLDLSKYHCPLIGALPWLWVQCYVLIKTGCDQGVY